MFLYYEWLTRTGIMFHTELFDLSHYRDTTVSWTWHCMPMIGTQCIKLSLIWNWYFWQNYKLLQSYCLNRVKIWGKLYRSLVSYSLWILRELVYKETKAQKSTWNSCFIHANTSRLLFWWSSEMWNNSLKLNKLSYTE